MSPSRPNPIADRSPASRSSSTSTSVRRSLDPSNPDAPAARPTAQDIGFDPRRLATPGAPNPRRGGAPSDHQRSPCIHFTQSVLGIAREVAAARVSRYKQAAEDGSSSVHCTPVTSTSYFCCKNDPSLTSISEGCLEAIAAATRQVTLLARSAFETSLGLTARLRMKVVPAGGGIEAGTKGLLPATEGCVQPTRALPGVPPSRSNSSWRGDYSF